MNKISIFRNENFGEIRVTEMNNEPLFCLVDVARCLGYANPAKAVIDHCKGVTILETPTQGGVQQIKYGTEGNVYRLIMKSHTQNAIGFQDWVTDEVLPSIRKHGAYMTEQTLEKALTSPDFLIQLATQMKDERAKRIEAERKVELMTPKALFADAVATSERSCLIGELAKMICQNGINIGGKRLFQWMRENNYLCSFGSQRNQPTQKAMELGLFEIKKTTVTKADGQILVTTTSKVTGKGQIYFINKFLNNGEKSDSTNVKGYACRR